MLLSGWENKQLHLVDHIAPEKRVTMLTIERDEQIEADIKEKCLVAIDFYYEYSLEFNHQEK